MSLLAQVVSVLETAGIPYALIGASALTVHGINRSTLDLDLLAVDASCLTEALWTHPDTQSIEVEIRRGDHTDPLAGVVRFSVPGERPLDLVIGKSFWQKRMLERARPTRFLGLSIPVIEPADLILLKLYAGGPQDAWDIQQLLLAENREALVAHVEQNLPDLPSRCARLWETILKIEAG